MSQYWIRNIILKKLLVIAHQMLCEEGTAH